jgi:hypothetical protein
MKRLKIYVGCALTSVPSEKRAEFETRVNEVKKMLKADHEVLEFVGLTNGTSRDVYMHDIHDCVAKADLFIALCDYPGTGLGYELCYAIEVKNIPTLALVQKDATVTRLVEGIQSQKFTFGRYINTTDLLAQVQAWVYSTNFATPV